MIRRSVTVAGIVAAAIFTGGCGPTAYKITPIPLSEKLVETTVARDDGVFLPKIAVVDIDGVLTNVRSSSLVGPGENPTALAIEKLRKAGGDSRVKAVVLRINSPGGTVTASDIVYREVCRLREGSDDRAGKPVIAMIMDVGASGGYYVACGASRIVGEPTGVTGSIGVVMLKFDMKGMLDKIGVGTDAIKSGAKKDAGSPFRPLEPDERKIFQNIIDEFHDNFVAVVAKGRDGLDVEEVRKLADGRIYSCAEGEKLGLIDHTGDIETAIALAKQVAEISAARVVMYNRPTGYRGSVYGSTAVRAGGEQGATVINLNLPDMLRAQGGFMYLWMP